jgi:hypothetical protein
MFARPVVRTSIPRGAPRPPVRHHSLSTGNRARDLRRRSMTMGMSSSCEAPDDARFSCGTGLGLRTSCVNVLDTRTGVGA